MKKILLLLIMVVFLNSLMAQDAETSSVGGKIYLGAKVGYGIVNFESVNSSVKNFAEMTFNNISFGIVAGYKVIGQISLQVEVNYAQYGARNIIPTYIYSPESPLLQSYNDNSTVDRVDMDLYYIDIPLIAKYSLAEAGLTPYVYGGVNWGINVIAKTTIVRAITETEVFYREFHDKITDRIIYNEFAPIIGGGLKMNVGSFSVFGDVRYKHGFKNLSNVDNNLGFKNSSIWISCGLIKNL